MHTPHHLILVNKFMLLFQNPSMNKEKLLKSLFFIICALLTSLPWQVYVPTHSHLKYTLHVPVNYETAAKLTVSGLKVFELDVLEFASSILI